MEEVFANFRLMNYSNRSQISWIEHQTPTSQLSDRILTFPTTLAHLLFANFSVHIPSDPLHDRPADCALTDPFAPEKQRNPENKDNSTDHGHFSIRNTISMCGDPGVRVKTKEEAKG